MATSTTPRPTKMLRLPEVVERTGLGRTTIYRMVTEGEFPQPRKLTSLVNGWPEAEVEAWLAGRPAATIGESVQGLDG